MEKHVMVVDDIRSICTTIELILEDEGFSVTKVLSGRDCIQRLKDGFRGVILMDIMMPNLDGWDTIRIIHDQGLQEGNIICMLTARDEPGPKSQGLEEMIFDYICKPFDNLKLIETVRRASEFL